MEKFRWPELQRKTAFPVARSGYPFIFAAAFVTLVFALLGITTIAVAGVIVTFCICGFFRDPDRVVTTEDGAVVSPADGKVIKVESLDSTRYYEGSCTRISVFMSLLNVHVNRVCQDGSIKKVVYQPGRFFAADRDNAPEDNEQNAVFLETADGKNICFVQIAGLVARRIICWTQPGDQVKRGERFGLICFGSRLDIYLPTSAEVRVKKGDRVQAGASVIGHL